MAERVAFHSDLLDESTTFQLWQARPRWIPATSASLSLDDWGALQGATLVERLRTVGGQPLDVEPHLLRLRQSAEVLGIRWPDYLSGDLVAACVEANRPAHAHVDFSVVILLTPGRAHAGPTGQRPTVIVHTLDLSWKSLARWYERGQALVTSENRNVPNACWSTHLKTRSRLHYYLADRQAEGAGISGAGAAMLSIDGYLTESSVANLLILSRDTLISPPIDSVLHGLSLRRTLRLADKLGIAVRMENIAPQRLEARTLSC